MSVNFFDSQYRTEPVRNDKRIGVCDPQNGTRAYTTTAEDKGKWMAEISNPKEMGVQFVAVDNNICMPEVNGKQQKRCDGMILYPLSSDSGNDAVSENICFVELKDVMGSGWIKEATEQLRATITTFCENHDYRKFKTRKAYAANCRHPNFNHSQMKRMTDFMEETHFQLIIRRTIIIGDDNSSNMP